MPTLEKLPISVVVITKNEEERLGECLKSVEWADEIVVVDDESTDGTVEVARAYTDKVLTRRMDVEGRHRNFAYAQASRQWVLSLDADERISPELREELKEVVEKNDPSIAAYSIPIRSFIGTQWIRSAGYYPARKVRLHRKGKFRYEEARVHPRAFLDGAERPLRGDILHYGFRDFSHFFDKLNCQTTLEAEKWVLEGRRVNALRIVYKMSDRFLRNYIGKGGIGDGFLGFVMSAGHALYQLLSYAKYWEFKHRHE